MDPDPTPPESAAGAVTPSRVCPAPTPSFSASPCPSPADLAPKWRALEARSDATFFTRFTWIGTWLQQLPADRKPQLLRVHSGERTVGLGVFVVCAARRLRGAVRHRAAVLHATGRQEDDDLTVEHNGLLLQRGLGPQVQADALAHLLRSGLCDEVRVPMAGGAGVQGRVQGKVPGVVRCAPQVGYAADLRRARALGADVLTTLSGPTRAKVRRSLRRYAELGPVQLRLATDVDEALHGLQRLKALHQAAWQARGLPGAFANPRFEAFHRALLQAGHSRGEVQLLSVHAGDREVGHLLQFRHGPRVLAYQSGFAYGLVSGNHHPGLVVHALAMQHALEQGAECYDFLAGDARYKTDLGGEPYPMGHWSLHRHGPVVWAQETLRIGRAGLAALADRTRGARDVRDGRDARERVPPAPQVPS